MDSKQLINPPEEISALARARTTEQQANAAREAVRAIHEEGSEIAQNKAPKTGAESLAVQDDTTTKRLPVTTKSPQITIEEKPKVINTPDGLNISNENKKADHKNKNIVIAKTSQKPIPEKNDDMAFAAGASYERKLSSDFELNRTNLPFPPDELGLADLDELAEDRPTDDGYKEITTGQIEIAEQDDLSEIRSADAGELEDVDELTVNEFLPEVEAVSQPDEPVLLIEQIHDYLTGDNELNEEVIDDSRVLVEEIKVVVEEIVELQNDPDLKDLATAEQLEDKLKGLAIKLLENLCTDYDDEVLFRFVQTVIKQETARKSEVQVEKSKVEEGTHESKSFNLRDFMFRMDSKIPDFRMLGRYALQGKELI